MNLLRWLITPMVLSFGGDDGGMGSGANMEAEEARKSNLRQRIDRLYGIDAPKGTGPKRERFVTQRAGQLPAGWRSAEGEGVEGQWFDPEGRLATSPPVPSREDVFDSVGYDKAVADFNALDEEAGAARTAMEGENTRLADATRGYYTDDLGRKYQKAERGTRFKLARQGLLGGSQDAYDQGEVKSDRDLGATRVDEAVRRAVAGLIGNREQERLNAVQLVNSGAGDSAVSAAQAGLRNTFENAASAQKANLFEDLFTSAADGASMSNEQAQQQALLGRYRDRLATFFPTSGTSSGRVTPTS